MGKTCAAFPGCVVQKRARRLIQLGGTPVEIARAEVCNGHNASRILRSHRHNARYTINEQERARRKRLLNPGGPLHSLLPAQRVVVYSIETSRGTVRERSFLFPSPCSLPMHILQYRSIGTRNRFFSPIEMCFHNRGRILK